MNRNEAEKFFKALNLEKSESNKTLDLNALSLHCNGQPFDEAPIEWQRVVEDMHKRGIRFEVMA